MKYEKCALKLLPTIKTIKPIIGLNKLAIVIESINDGKNVIGLIAIIKIEIIGAKMPRFEIYDSIAKVSSVRVILDVKK